MKKVIDALHIGEEDIASHRCLEKKSATLIEKTIQMRQESDLVSTDYDRFFQKSQCYVAPASYDLKWLG